MATDISFNGISAVPAIGDGFRALVVGSPQAKSSFPPAVETSLPSLTLDKAVQQLGQRAAEQGAALDFRIDEDSGRVVVSVVDQADGTVLRQMPSAEALQIARSLAKLQTHLIQAEA